MTPTTRPLSLVYDGTFWFTPGFGADLNGAMHSAAGQMMCGLLGFHGAIARSIIR